MSTIMVGAFAAVFHQAGLFESFREECSATCRLPATAESTSKRPREDSHNDKCAEDALPRGTSGKADHLDGRFSLAEYAPCNCNGNCNAYTAGTVFPMAPTSMPSYAPPICQSPDATNLCRPHRASVLFRPRTTPKCHKHVLHNCPRGTSTG